MTQLLKRLSVAAFTIALGVAPAISADVSPVGSWQLASGESRYMVSECGDSGELCAKLVWLRDDARTAENLQYLNQYVVRGVQTTANKWRGTAEFEGQTVKANVTMVDANTLQLKGCKLFCKTFELKRI